MFYLMFALEVVQIQYLHKRNLKDQINVLTPNYISNLLTNASMCVWMSKWYTHN